MLTEKIRDFKSSPLQDFFKRAGQNKDVISLAVGDLGFPTPLPVKKAVEDAIQRDFTHYTPAAGIWNLRRLAAAEFQQSGIETAAPENTIIGPGAKPLIAAALLTICSPEGDEVLFPSPFYPPYNDLALRFTGWSRMVDTMKHGFTLKAEQIQEAISEKTRIIILNSPSNPTGMVWDPEEIKRIEAGDNTLFILDEAYFWIRYDGKYTSFATLPNIKDRAIVIRSCSKTFAMSGFRIGYLTGPKKIVDKIQLCLETAIGCPCSISQRAAEAAFASFFKDQRETGRRIKMLDSRRKYLMKWLDERDIPYPVPQGAFYVFADFSRWGSSMEVAEKLLEEAKVAVTPGTAFGPAISPYDGWLRISYAPVPIRRFKIALSRINKVLDNKR